MDNVFSEIGAGPDAGVIPASLWSQPAGPGLLAVRPLAIPTARDYARAIAFTSDPPTNSKH